MEKFDKYSSKRFLRKFNKKLRDKLRIGMILDSVNYNLDSDLRISELVLIKSFKLKVYAWTYKCELRYFIQKNKIKVFILDESEYLIPLDFEINISKLGKGHFSNEFAEWLKSPEEITKKLTTGSEKIINTSLNIIKENLNKIEQISEYIVTI